MRTLYQAQNTVEAHMIINMLQQAGVEARRDGEYLQGAVGEIAPFGNVRVRVDESDYDKAREIIDDWEALQPPEDSKPIMPVVSERQRSFFPFLFGFACGVFVMAILSAAEG